MITQHSATSTAVRSGRLRCGPMFIIILSVSAVIVHGATNKGAAPASPKEFRIPTFNFSPRPNAVVVVDAVEKKYLGQPDTVLLADGKTILVGYPEGHGHPNTLLRKSTDGGLTWSERLPTPTSFTADHYAPSLHRLTDKAGIERLLIFVSYPWLKQSISTDNGSSWSAFQRIFPENLRTSGYKGTAPPKSIIRLKDGQYLAMYNDNIDADGRKRLNLTTLISRDGGLSWDTPKSVGNHPALPDAGPCEPALIRSPHGNQILAMVREQSRKYSSLYMVSDNEGETWSDLREMPPEITGDRHDPHYAPDGRLITTFRDMAAGSRTYGDFVLWVGAYEDVLAGRPGQYRVRLLDNLAGPGETGYAGMEILPDGTIVSVTYCDLTDNGTPDPQVVCVRYTMAELDALARQR